MQPDSSDFEALLSPASTMLEKSCFSPQWKKTSFPHTQDTSLSPKEQCWLVFCDKLNIGDAIIRQLENTGREVIIINIGDALVSIKHNTYTLNPYDSDQYHFLLEELCFTEKYPTHILYLWTLFHKSHNQTAIDFFKESQIFGLYGLISLIQSLEILDTISQVQLYIVTNNCLLVSNEDFLYPEKTTILGLPTDTQQRFSHIHCQIIDVAFPDYLENKQKMQLLFEAITTSTHDVLVAYRHGQRWTPIYETVDLKNLDFQEAYFHDNEVYLFTNGLSSCSLDIATNIAMHAKISLIFVDPAGFPNNDEWPYWLQTHPQDDPTSQKIQRLSKIKDLGSTLLILQYDTTIADENIKLVKLLHKQFSFIHGVFSIIESNDTTQQNTLLSLEYKDYQELVQSHIYNFYSLIDLLADFVQKFFFFPVFLFQRPASPFINAYHNFFSSLCIKNSSLYKNSWKSLLWEDHFLNTENFFSLLFSIKEITSIFSHVVPSFDRHDDNLYATFSNYQHIVFSKEKAPLKDKVTSSTLAPSNTVEQILVALWQELLGATNISICDNFFLVGGNSLSLIYMISRMNEIWPFIDLSTLLQHVNLTIAEIATFVKNSSPTPDVKHDIIQGELPIFSGGQKWSLSAPLSHRYITTLLEAPLSCDYSLLCQTVDQLLRYHDILRIRISKNSNQWHQSIIDVEDSLPITQVNLGELADNEIEPVIKEISQRHYQELNNYQGSLIRFIYFCGRHEQPDLLLCIIHHALTDAFSQDIFWKDFQMIYRQLSKKEPLSLPRKTTSFKEYMERIVDYVQNSVIDSEFDYWKNVPEARIIPFDAPKEKRFQKPNIHHTVSVALSEEETFAFFQLIPQHYVSFMDLLLASLVQSFMVYANIPYTILSSIDHGRSILPHVDLSHTMGYMTILRHLYLQAYPDEDPEQVIHSIKKQVELIPNKGFGWELLYQYSQKEEIQANIKRSCPFTLGFNYLGSNPYIQHDDQEQQEIDLFTYSNEYSTAIRQDIKPENDNDDYSLQCTVVTRRKQLTFIWGYIENQYKYKTILKLAQTQRAILQKLIRYCVDVHNQ